MNISSSPAHFSPLPFRKTEQQSATFQSRDAAAKFFLKAAASRLGMKYVCLVAAVTSLLAVQNLGAQTIRYWTGAGANTTWTNTANWQDAVFADTADIAGFNAASYPRIPNAATREVAGILVGSSSGAMATIQAATSGIGLTIGSSGIDMSNAGANLTLGQSAAQDFTLGANQVWNVAASRTLSAVGTIHGSAGFTKQGSGTVDLSTTNTYTGSTTISAGTLILSVNGNINSSSGVSVGASGTFTNNNVSSTVGPFTKALTLAEGAVLNGTNAFAPSSLTITANLSNGFTTFALGTTSLTKAGNLELTLSGITAGDYTLFSGSVLPGTFSTMTIGGNALTPTGGGNFTGLLGGIEYTFTDSNNMLEVIPEPSTLLLFGVGAMVLLLRRRRAAQI